MTSTAPALIHSLAGRGVILPGRMDIGLPWNPVPLAAPLQSEATGCFVPRFLPDPRRTLAGGFALPASFFPAGGYGPQAAAFVFQRDGNSVHGFSG